MTIELILEDLCAKAHRQEIDAGDELLRMSIEDGYDMTMLMEKYYVELSRYREQHFPNVYRRPIVPKTNYVIA